MKSKEQDIGHAKRILCIETICRFCHSLIQFRLMANNFLRPSTRIINSTKSLPTNTQNLKGFQNLWIQSLVLLGDENPIDEELRCAAAECVCTGSRSCIISWGRKIRIGLSGLALFSSGWFLRSIFRMFSYFNAALV
jgi:hypothetical protein